MERGCHRVLPMTAWPYILGKELGQQEWTGSRERKAWGNIPPGIHPRELVSPFRLCFLKSLEPFKIVPQAEDQALICELVVGVRISDPSHCSPERFADHLLPPRQHSPALRTCYSSSFFLGFNHTDAFIV